MTRKQREFKPENVTENEIYKFITAQWQHQNQMGWSRLYFVLALETATLSAAYSVKQGRVLVLVLLL